MSLIEIQHCVDLVIYLLDTVTGFMFSGKKVDLFKNGIKIEALKKDSGIYILYNCGREDFILTIHAYGYEYSRYSVNYENLDKKIPVIYVQLIPKRTIENDAEITELTGNHKGLETIDAVNTKENFFYLSEYDEKKQILTLFNYMGKTISGVEYAIVNSKKTEYEVFEIQKKISEYQLEIKSVLEKYYAANFMISRIIHGMVERNGDYTLRLKLENDYQKDEKEKTKYIIRRIVNGVEQFQCLDLGHGDG